MLLCTEHVKAPTEINNNKESQVSSINTRYTHERRNEKPNEDQGMSKNVPSLAFTSPEGLYRQNSRRSRASELGRGPEQGCARDSKRRESRGQVSGKMPWNVWRIKAVHAEGINVDKEVI